MFTIIIPTIKKSNLWKKQIELLIENPFIKEIIIVIDLEYEFNQDLEFEKVRVIYTGGGCFCNGSWNKGVEYAEDAENIILANDDIVFDPNIVNIVADINLEDFGIIGLGTETKRVISRPFGFGQLMFMKRKHYTPIPEGIKHWYGDDWLFYKMSLIGKPNYTLDCRLFEREESASSGSELVQERIKKDTEWWELNNEPFKQFFWK